MLLKTKYFFIGSLFFLIVLNLQPASAQTPNTDNFSRSRIITEEPLGENESTTFSKNSQGWVAVMSAMLVASVLGGYYLHQKEKERKNGNQ